MDEPTNVIAYKNLGETLLAHTLSTAYLTVAKTPLYTNTKVQHEAMESIVFILDGGVDVIIADFALGYNPDKLKELFFYFLKDSYKEIKNDLPAGYSNQKLDTIISFIETSKILD
jgi:hypothetical protein